MGKFVPSLEQIVLAEGTLFNPYSSYEGKNTALVVSVMPLVLGGSQISYFVVPMSCCTNKEKVSR